VVVLRSGSLPFAAREIAGSCVEGSFRCAKGPAWEGSSRRVVALCRSGKWSLRLPFENRSVGTVERRQRTAATALTYWRNRESTQAEPFVTTGLHGIRLAAWIGPALLKDNTPSGHLAHRSTCNDYSGEADRYRECPQGTTFAPRGHFGRAFLNYLAHKKTLAGNYEPTGL